MRHRAIAAFSVIASVLFAASALAQGQAPRSGPLPPAGGQGGPPPRGPAGPPPQQQQQQGAAAKPYKAVAISAPIRQGCMQVYQAVFFSVIRR